MDQDAATPASGTATTASLWDWRRRMADLWHDIRAAADPEAGWRLWRETRAGDGEVKLVPFADTSGLRQALGGELTLYWVTGYGGGVFLPFLDATSGTETYGGGRYLLDTIKSADHGTTPDGRTVLDFNFAYNPSCYYSPRWVCPLAPRDKRLPVAVRGGEKGHLP